MINDIFLLINIWIIYTYDKYIYIGYVSPDRMCMWYLYTFLVPVTMSAHTHIHCLDLLFCKVFRFSAHFFNCVACHFICLSEFFMYSGTYKFCVLWISFPLCLALFVFFGRKLCLLQDQEAVLLFSHLPALFFPYFHTGLQWCEITFLGYVVRSRRYFPPPLTPLRISSWSNTMYWKDYPFPSVL